MLELALCQDVFQSTVLAPYYLTLIVYVYWHVEYFC